MRAYLGEVDGQPVTTALGVTLGAHVGLFNVATPPRCRGHGFGAAVTARAVADGLEAGATWSWLQASPSGYRIYEDDGTTYRYRTNARDVSDLDMEGTPVEAEADHARA